MTQNAHALIAFNFRVMKSIFFMSFAFTFVGFAKNILLKVTHLTIVFDFVFPDCQLNDDEQEDSLRADTSRLPAHSLLLPKGVQPRAAPPDIPALVQRENHLQDQGGVGKLCQR